ncbi:hypothetical protein [Pseudomonas plecoglossicida]|uniref:hypothetical protein n=1 Tax=Pseudomonas plecoglossicida TaxID=70775 RepID=UPI0015E7EFD9|nr:hypothetical protein [Pseudomonas plecoglossicida]
MNMIIALVAISLWVAVMALVPPKQRFLVWSIGASFFVWGIWPHVNYLGVHP